MQEETYMANLKAKRGLIKVSQISKTNLDALLQAGYIVQVCQSKTLGTKIKRSLKLVRE